MTTTHNEGEFNVVFHGDRLRILRADPVTRISGALLVQLQTGDHHSDVELRDDVLTVHGVNRTVVYRIDFDSYDRETWSFRMEWPD